MKARLLRIECLFSYSNSPMGIYPLAKRTRDDATPHTLEISRSSPHSLAFGDAVIYYLFVICRKQSLKKT